MVSESKKKTTPEGDASSPPTETRKAKKSGSSGSVASSLSGYAAVFQHWVPVPCEEGVIEVPPTVPKHVFDVRAVTEPPTKEFVESIRGGILQPPRLTKMKYVGPADPKAGLKTDTEYFVIVYGRKRLGGADIVGHKSVLCTLKGYADWQAMVADAAQENGKREDMSHWDWAVLCKSCEESGMIQDQIAARLGMKAAWVSQHLGVFKLAPPVQALVRSGALGITSVRALKALDDEDAQLTLANRAIEKGWDNETLAEQAKIFKDRADAKAAKEAEKEGRETPERKRITASTDFSSAAISTLKAAEYRQILNYYATKLAQEKGKDEADPAKLAAAKARVETALVCAGLKPPPKAALATDEDEE